MPAKKPFQRLPQDVVPVNYALEITPNIKDFTFAGIEEIAIEVKNPTNVITLNSVCIDIKNVSYAAEGQGFTEGVQISYAEADETATFTFPEELRPGKGFLTLDFTGELNDKMKGFYRSKYFSPEGEERYGACTQFEATDARQAFPCWDEPAVKATFDITLIVPEDRVALSNMPVKSEVTLESLPVKKKIAFERTPIMSTYLLAFIVGEYDYIEDTDDDGVKVRVYTPVGKKVQGSFALEVAVKTLPFYNKYFKVPYPLPKIDLIAIADFAAGAMENWGLVTYRETALLIDPENSSSAAKQWVALVVGHELAHQWFGNLVTMEWWTHLWLNEGFASWIEYLCVDHCFPEYDIWTQFASNDYTRALELDALRNSHPIEVPVGHPSEVDEIFDTISYSKGASVIRMLHDFIGDEDYAKGMNVYLTRHKYKNTFTEDLWAALGEASGKPVHDIMTTWTKQMGFPVLSVSEKKDGTNRTLTISQRKFCADGDSTGDVSLWMVPVSVSTASSPEKAVHKFVLDSKDITVTIENVDPNDWLKINVGSVGFYRTQYSSEMLESLLVAIRDKSLPPRDRLGLQNDLFALARAGVASTVDALKVAQAFVNETNYTVWSDLSTNLSVISICLQYTDFHESFKAFQRQLFGSVAERLGWDPKDGEGHLDAMLRSLVIGKMGRTGHQPTIDEAKKRFAAHCGGTNALPADLRAPVYVTVLSSGDQATYDELLKLFRSADLHEEKVRIMRSLGTIKEDSLKQKVLEFAMSDEIRSQDTVFAIAGVTGSAEGRELAWNFVRANWTELHERYKGGFLLARLVKSTTENFADDLKANEVEEFFKEHEVPAAERTVKQAIENIFLNKNQLQRDQESIKKFLAA